MQPIPPPIRVLLNEDANKTCARRNEGGCSGRITVEHTYGRKHQERWMLLWLCWEHHLGRLFDKNKNRWLALNQARDEDFAKYPKSAMGWRQEKKYYNEIYGKPFR